MTTDNNITVFLVDDDKLFINALKYALNKTATSIINIISFSNGEDCIQYLRKQKPGIIILDYYLNKNYPDAINGLETLKKIKRISPGSEVIMISSQEDIQVAMETLNNGAYDYIVKGETALTKIKSDIESIIDDTEFEKSIIDNTVKLRTLYFLTGACLLFYILYNILGKEM